MRRIVLGLSWLGVLLFGAAFFLSFARPLLVERLATEVVRIEIERSVGQRIDALTDSRVAGFAQRALGRGDDDIARIRQAIRDQVPVRVAQVVGDMLQADCPCRKRLAGAVRDAYDQHLWSLNQVREQLVRMIESSYAAVTIQLLREFRIVTASNALAFAALGLTTLARGRTALQVLLPALVLVAATLVTAGLYLFQQDWLHTLVFGDYVGAAYAAWLAAVAALLADVALNRARVTNRVLSAVGALPVAVPC